MWRPPSVARGKGAEDVCAEATPTHNARSRLVARCSACGTECTVMAMFWGERALRMEKGARSKHVGKEQYGQYDQVLTLSNLLESEKLLYEVINRLLLKRAD